MVRRRGKMVHKGFIYDLSPAKGSTAHSIKQMRIMERDLKEMFQGILDAHTILDVLEDCDYDKERATEALIGVCHQMEQRTRSHQHAVGQQQDVSLAQQGESNSWI